MNIKTHEYDGMWNIMTNEIYNDPWNKTEIIVEETAESLTIEQS